MKLCGWFCLIFLATPSHADIWQQYIDGNRFLTPPNEVSLNVEYQKWLASNVNISLDKAKPWLVYVLKQIQARGLPSELALVPLIESAYVPVAVSATGATGMWQFTQETAEHFNLSKGRCDGRLDVIKSTYAALDYLSELRIRFGSWELALAAYNGGPSTVERAQQKNLQLGLATDFWHLHELSQQTQHYVPKLLALNKVISERVNNRYQLPILPKSSLFATFYADDETWEEIQKITQWDKSLLQHLNPCWGKDGLITGEILVPKSQIAEFVLIGWLSS